MSFLAPLTLIGLGLAALPVLIHLLVRRRAKRLDFPSLRFLRETPSFRLFPRHVRQPLLLALRLAALALIVAGLARPFIPFNVSDGRTRIILIDASLSMRARGRAEAAREQARAILNRLGAGESAAILAFSSEVFVLAEATRDRKRLMAALESYEPSGGAANYTMGLASASALLQQLAHGPAEIDLISDFQEGELASQLSEWPETVAARVVPYAIGTALERNAFLMDEALARDAPEGAVELSATEMVSDADGQSGARRVWTLDAGDGTRADLQWHTETNGQITGAARANAPDDFDADDQHFFAFAPPRENRALLVETDAGGDGPYLRAALEAAGVEGGGGLALDRKGELPVSAAELNSYALVVLSLHGAPREAQVRALSEYARAGGIAWLCLARDIDTESWNTLAGTQQGSALPFASLSRTTFTEPFGFGAVDADSPALRSMGESALAALRATRVRTGFVLIPRESALTLARWSDGTHAFVSAETGAGSILLLATSPEREAGELGLSPALPALAHSILSLATSPREPLSRTIGEPVRLSTGPDTDVIVTNTEGRTTRAKARELAQRPFGIFREPGVYRLDFAGQQLFMAFNAPVAESARALATPEEIKNYTNLKESPATPAANDRREAQERRGYLWRLFLCAAFVLLVAELFVAMRRGHRDEIMDAAPDASAERA